MTCPLLLASASPRRRELLELAGLPFEAVAPAVEELSAGDPAEVVRENALRKAAEGLRLRPGAGLVLGADTDVVLDGGVLGKPEDEMGARARLEALAGRTHEVLGGIAVLGGDEGERTAVVRTAVTFAELDTATLELYLASGEWRDRAGGYAVQGLGSALVERVDGDLANVIGLPLRALFALAPELARLR